MGLIGVSTEKKFVPFLKYQPGFQEQAFKSKCFLTILAGGAGSGKTHVCLMKALEHIKDPNYRCGIFRSKRTEIFNPGGLWDELLSMCSTCRITVKTNKHQLRVTFPSGAIIQFRFQKEKAITMHELRGAEFTRVIIDEADNLAYEIFQFIPSRMRTSKSSVIPQMFITMNPNNKWPMMFAKYFLNEDEIPDPDKCGKTKYFHYINNEPVLLDSKEEFIAKHGVAKEHLEFIQTCTFIPSTVLDNKILLEKNPTYLASLHQLPPDKKLKFLYGSWAEIPAGKVFEEKDFKLYSSLPPNSSIDRAFIVGDTALKAGATSDFSVFTLWITSGNDLYLVDMIRGKWDYPQLRARLRDFVENNLYCDACYLEDFGTGTVLLKDLPTDIKAVRFRAVDRSSRRSSKAMRAQESKSYLEHISVHLPIESESIRRKFLKEVCGFSLDMDHANDDICDTFFDAARILGETVRRKIRPSNPEIEVKLIQKIEQGYASSRSIGGRF